ncbi:MAG: galactoside ABC transporter permease [Bacilli bacterium]|jgi:methyl-galactoside transport system permease protein|nr:galactoside ABC transporter permease [Bacilli bacterium]
MADEKKVDMKNLSVKTSTVPEKKDTIPEKITNPDLMSPLETDEKIKNFEKSLYELRKDGTIRIQELDEELYDIKHNKMISDKERNKIIANDEMALKKAKTVKAANAQKIKAIVNQAVAYTKKVGKDFENKVKLEGQKKVQEALPGHNQALAKIEQDHQKDLQALQAKQVKDRHDFEENFKKEFAEASVKLAQAQKASFPSEEAKKHEIALRISERNGIVSDHKKGLKRLENDFKQELASEKIAKNSDLKDEKTKFENLKQKAKDNQYAAYMATYNEVNRLRGGKASFVEGYEHRFKEFQYSFVFKKFLLNNALYITIIFFFIVCGILSQSTGKGNLFSWANILQLLENSSTRMFYALGVAGLIVLAGTDLSVGRMVAVGSVITSYILHGLSDQTLLWFGGTDTTNIFYNTPMILRVLLALIISIALCTFFSAIAGFFSAKFKMHPFITTLSTELIIYGIMTYGTGNVAVGPMDSNIRDIIGGRIYIYDGDPGFPILAIYALVAIIIMWFIWNKTKFGKDMFAVGNNPEAAAVSGISYFKVTLATFIMAGVCYGIGSFLEAFKTNPSASTGQGYELDAIAACVVGGISFFGGIGKIKGAVIGVLIFTGMTYALTVLKLDTNLQFVFKGIIIMAAVALDSVKYLRRK